MPRPVTPQLATDLVIELTDRPGRPIVLIRRLNPPHGWALPGGFVDVGETVTDAAAREAREETGLAVTGLRLLDVYSDPSRDPRGHTASVVYVARATGTPVGQDDAEEAGVFAIDALPSLVFDHDEIVADYLRWRAAETDR